MLIIYDQFDHIFAVRYKTNGCYMLIATLYYYRALSSQATQSACYYQVAIILIAPIKLQLIQCKSKLYSQKHIEVFIPSEKKKLIACLCNYTAPSWLKLCGNGIVNAQYFITSFRFPYLMRLVTNFPIILIFSTIP